MRTSIHSVRESFAFLARRGDSLQNSAQNSTTAKRSAWSMFLCIVLLFAFGAPAYAGSQPQVQFLGVFTPAITKGLTLPFGVAVDTSGNIYVADYALNAVLKGTLQSDGSYVQSTIASGFIDPPTAIAVDGAGNVYIGLNYNDDLPSHLIKETLQGDGTYSKSYIGNINSVYGIAVDAGGNIYATYVAGTGFVAKFTLSGSTYNFSSIYSSPNLLAGLALENSGDLFVADQGTNTLHELTPSGNPATATTYAASTITIGAGAAVFGLAVDSDGNLYAADTSGSLRMEAPNGSGYTETVLASGLNSLIDVTVSPAGAIYFGQSEAVDEFQIAPVNFGPVRIAATSSTKSFIFSFSGSITGVSPLVSLQGTTGADFNDTRKGTCTTNGSSYSYNSGDTCTVNVSFSPQLPGVRYGAVQLVNGSGQALAVASVLGTGVGPQIAFYPGAQTSVSNSLSYPIGLKVDGARNIYVASTEDSQIVKFVYNPSNGSYNTASLSPYALSYPTGIAVDGAGNVYVSDDSHHQIVYEPYEAGGYPLADSTPAITGLGCPNDVAVDLNGSIYVADGCTTQLSKYTLMNGAYTQSTVDTGFDNAYAVAVDNAANVYVADTGNNRVVKETRQSNGTYVQSTIGTGVSGPQGIAVDGNGNVFISDTNNNRVLMETLSGGTYTQTVVYTQPGAALEGVAVDNSGDLYIVDRWNCQVVILNASSLPALSFADTLVGSTSSDSPKVVQVMNAGNDVLHFEAPASGQNPYFASASTDFSQTTGLNPCPVMLAGAESAGPIQPNASCNIWLNFQPSAVGPLSNILNILDDSLNAASPYAVHSIPMVGNGTAPPLTSTSTTWSSILPSPAIAGQPVTFTATVSPAPTGSPTGTVSFYNERTLLGSETIDSSGIATFTTSSLTAGSMKVRAVYSGNTGYAASASNVVTEVVNPAQITSVLSWTQPSAITYGTNLSTILNATASTGSGAIPGTFAYTATPTRGSASAANSATVLAAGSYTLAVTFTPADTKTYTTAAQTVSLTVNTSQPTINFVKPAALAYGSNLSSVLPTVATNGPTTIPGTFSYTVTLSGGKPVNVTSATVLEAGSYTLAVTFTPTDTTDYQVVSESAVLAVNKASAAIKLTSSVSSVFAKNPVTFTATVSPTIGTPGGTVSFYDGTTRLGAANLTAGVATYITSTLSANVHSITAVYSGDNNFNTVTSAALSEQVQDLSLTLTSGGATTATAVPGGQAVYPLIISPLAGTKFPGVVTLTLSGLPAGATGSLTPDRLPANSGATPVKLVVTLPSQAATQSHRNPFGGGYMPLAFAFVLLPFAGKRLSRKAGALGCLLLIGIATASLMGLAGCGKSSSGYNGQGPQSYNLTITATSGSLSHSTTVNLTVQ